MVTEDDGFIFSDGLAKKASSMAGRSVKPFLVYDISFQDGYLQVICVDIPSTPRGSESMNRGKGVSESSLNKTDDDSGEVKLIASSICDQAVLEDADSCVPSVNHHTKEGSNKMALYVFDVLSQTMPTQDFSLIIGRDITLVLVSQGDDSPVELCCQDVIVAATTSRLVEFFRIQSESFSIRKACKDNLVFAGFKVANQQEEHHHRFEFKPENELVMARRKNGYILRNPPFVTKNQDGYACKVFDTCPDSRTEVMRKELASNGYIVFDGMPVRVCLKIEWPTTHSLNDAVNPARGDIRVWFCKNRKKITGAELAFVIRSDSGAATNRNLIKASPHFVLVGEVTSGRLLSVETSTTGFLRYSYSDGQQGSAGSGSVMNLYQFGEVLELTGQGGQKTSEYGSYGAPMRIIFDVNQMGPPILCDADLEEYGRSLPENLSGYFSLLYLFQM